MKDLVKTEIKETIIHNSLKIMYYIKPNKGDERFI